MVNSHMQFILMVKNSNLWYLVEVKEIIFPFIAHNHNFYIHEYVVSLVNRIIILLQLSGLAPNNLSSPLHRFKLCYS